jgi:hypothetical protein
MTDSDGVLWIGTVNTSGVLSFALASNNAGMPMGLLLALTYSS